LQSSFTPDHDASYSASDSYSVQDFTGNFYKVLYDRSKNEVIDLESIDSDVFHSVSHYRSRKTANRSQYGFRGNGSLRSCYVEVKADGLCSTWAGTILFYFVVTHKTTGRRLAFARVRWFDVPANGSEAKAMASKLVGGSATLTAFQRTSSRTFPECPTFRYGNSGGLPFRIGQGNINIQILGQRNSAAPDDWVDVGALVTKVCVAPLCTNVSGKQLSDVPESTGNCIFGFWQQHAPYGYVNSVNS
jgi:hypothetical protein